MNLEPPPHREILVAVTESGDLTQVSAQRTGRLLRELLSNLSKTFDVAMRDSPIPADDEAVFAVFILHTGLYSNEYAG